MHETSVLLMSLAGGSVAVILSLVFLWTGDFASRTQWTLTLLLLGTWFSFAFAARSLVVRPLQTLANMHAALREGDYSMRARSAGANDALSELMREINALTDALREEKLEAVEAGALLHKVMAEIEVAIFAFDSEERLRLMNRAGERLLGASSERVLGSTAEQLGLSECLQGPAAQTLERSFAGGTGRWGVRRSSFRQGGVPHHLLVMADLSRALREEERQAWQRLLRVLGHELNNSLAPIRSIAGSLEVLLKRSPRPGDWEEDLLRGLRVIGERAEALSRFMRDYARLTRLPKPSPQPIELDRLIDRLAGLETRLKIQIRPGPPLRFEADPDQLEQLLINILRNAVDASLETRGAVDLSWSSIGGFVDITIRDEGPGIPDTANLFVPFFTTKPGGSGIGLALCRQIAEAHHGSITLQNREAGSGCEAHILLPLRPVRESMDKLVDNALLGEKL